MNGKLYAYPLPYEDALKNGEQDAYWESYRRNIDCAAAIRDAIAGHYRDNRLGDGCADAVIARFGYDRVGFVLAYTIQNEMHDGRISRENKAWAQERDIPFDGGPCTDRRQGYHVPVHPGLLDIFTSMVREQQENGFIPKDHCRHLDGGSLEGRLLVLDAGMVRDAGYSADWQLFYCMGDDGNELRGVFLKDGTGCSFGRGDFYEELAPEHVTSWMAECMEAFGQPELGQRQEEEPQMGF